MRRGAAPRERLSASPSEGAGSVEITRVRFPAAADTIARAAAQVVLPTPPFPPTKRYRVARGSDGARSSVRGMLVAFEGGLDAGDLVVLRRERRGPGTLPPIANLAQARENLRLELVELCLAQLSELHAHLRRQQLLAKRGVVVQLGIHRRGNLVEHEPQPADEHRIEYEHWRLPIRDRVSLVRAFKLEANIDEVVRRPRPGVLEGQLVVALRSRLQRR